MFAHTGVGYRPGRDRGRIGVNDKDVDIIVTLSVYDGSYNIIL